MPSPGLPELLFSFIGLLIPIGLIALIAYVVILLRRIDARTAAMQRELDRSH